MDLASGIFGMDLGKDVGDGELKLPAITDTRTPTLKANPDVKHVTADEVRNAAPIEEQADGDESPAPTKYPCSTQTKADPKDLYLVWDGVVKLWKKGSVVKFAVRKSGFPTAAKAASAARALTEAANTWNSHNFGVRFKFTESENDACFVLIYSGYHSYLYAAAFPPNPSNLSAMYMYSPMLDRPSIMAPVFLHELGHVLGLRHEFAPREARYGSKYATTLFGETNPRSVMSYTNPPAIQTSDVRGIKALYNSTAARIGNFPVTRYSPDN